MPTGIRLGAVNSKSRLAPSFQAAFLELSRPLVLVYTGGADAAVISEAGHADLAVGAPLRTGRLGECRSQTYMIRQNSYFKVDVVS